MVYLPHFISKKILESSLPTKFKGALTYGPAISLVNKFMPKTHALSPCKEAQCDCLRKPERGHNQTLPQHVDGETDFAVVTQTEFYTVFKNSEEVRPTYQNSSNLKIIMLNLKRKQQKVNAMCTVCINF